MATLNTKNTNPTRPWWQRVLLWLVGLSVGITAIVALALCVVVWILTPEKLTPLVEKYANEYLNADVHVGRVELSLCRNFPKLELSVDSLTVISRGLDGMTEEKRAALPAYADTLVTVPRFSGAINISALLVGAVDLYDIDVVRPSINVVYADSVISNLNITKPDLSAVDTTNVVLPRISINRFAIVGEAPIRYFSLADTTDIELAIKSVNITSDGVPVYRVDSSVRAHGMIGAVLPRVAVDLGLNGNINWNPENPTYVGLDNFMINIGPIVSKLEMVADMTGEMPVVQKLQMAIEPVKIEDVMAIFPEEWKAGMLTLCSDMMVAGSLHLLKPYSLASAGLPTVSVSLDINEGKLDYENMHLSKCGAGIDFDIVGDSLSASTITLRKLHAQGKAMDFKVEAKIADPFNDPLISGDFSGRVSLHKLPTVLVEMIPAQVSGTLTGNTDFRFRVSQLNSQSVHRIKMNGRMNMSQFNMLADDSMSVYMHSAELAFGTNNSIVRDSLRTDSLLTVAATIDSACVSTPEMSARLKDFKIGIGCKNTASMLDTTSITPIGATIHAGSIAYISHVDSTRMFLRNIDCGALLTRFKGHDKVPMVGLRASLERAFIGDRHARLLLRGGHFDITAHMNPRPRLNQRIQSRYDSIMAANPDISPDSVWSIMRSRYRRMNIADDVERMSLTIDKGTAALLRRLDVKGSLSAASGRIVTPMFPLRNQLSDLDCRFTADSIVLRNATLRAGESDLTMSGTISNIRNSLTSKFNTKPLRIDVSLQSDTFNINQLTQAVFKGMLAAQNNGTLSVADMDADGENSEAMQDSINASSEQLQGAVLVPVNIAADIKVNARNVIYADVPLHDFSGALLVENGALNLRDLSAHTDIGSASMNALYYAPKKSDIMFGMGLKLNDFHIGKVVQMMPQIDSIMPILKDINGIIDVNLATTTRIDSLMNFDLPSLKAALQMEGDSLVVLDQDTYKTMAKWLMFKNKHNNMINHMEVEMVVENSMLELYPFMFDFDRYRLGVMGSNDLAMNLNYHVAVLKSPLPFKFGINITGNADDMKIRVGKAKFKENMVGERVAIADTTRINLIAEIDRVFKRGINAARLAPLKVRRPITAVQTQELDTLAHADSIALINEGLIEASVLQTPEKSANQNDRRKKK